MNDNQTWMTIEQAAVALGLSVRTVNRHINAGKLQSRLTDGRREVLMDYAAPVVPAGQGAAGAGTYGSGQAGGAVLVADGQVNVNSADAVDYETVLALADNAADKAELAVSAFQTLARAADERARNNRRLTAAAWALVAVMATAAFASLGWTTHRLTKASVEQQHLREQVTAVAAAADSADHECDDLRIALAQAREEAARAEGRLAAYSESHDTAGEPAEPTSRPTLSERIASIFED